MLVGEWGTIGDKSWQIPPNIFSCRQIINQFQTLNESWVEALPLTTNMELLQRLYNLDIQTCWDKPHIPIRKGATMTIAVFSIARPSSTGLWFQPRKYPKALVARIIKQHIQYKHILNLQHLSSLLKTRTSANEMKVYKHNKNHWAAAIAGICFGLASHGADDLWA